MQIVKYFMELFLVTYVYKSVSTVSSCEMFWNWSAKKFEKNWLRKSSYVGFCTHGRISLLLTVDIYTAKCK